jgi:hypothetical protein
MGCNMENIFKILLNRNIPLISTIFCLKYEVRQPSKQGVHNRNSETLENK